MLVKIEIRYLLAFSCNINFDGKIDGPRSNELLLDKKQPEWNPTVGFAEDASHAVKLSGFSFSVGFIWALCGIQLLL